MSLQRKPPFDKWPTHHADPRYGYAWYLGRGLIVSHLTVDNRGKKLYFVDNTAGQARRTNLDGSGGFETLLTDVTYAMGVDLYICSP